MHSRRSFFYIIIYFYLLIFYKQGVDVLNKVLIFYK